MSRARRSEQQWCDLVDLQRRSGLSVAAFCDRHDLCASTFFLRRRLLSHLTATDDPEVDEFIALRRLNQNLVVVMDSDKGSAAQRINKTKRRVRNEFNGKHGHAWVTQGREIENYVQISLMRAAVEAIHPELGKKVTAGQYENLLHIRRSTLDKMRIAMHVTSKTAELDVLDLRKQINKLVDFIKKANTPDE